MNGTLTIGDCAHLACVLEATARKAGNVTRFVDFDDLTYLDFVLSAAAVAPVIGRVNELGVGRTILEGVRETKRFVATNSNLGMLLLLAPLAAVPDGCDFAGGVVEVLNKLTVEDSRHVFAAIRLANPGGLGESTEQDVHAEPTLPLREVMALAADRDLIARQYANGFADVLGERSLALRTHKLEPAIVQCHLRFIAEFGDSHIARKCGPEIAAEAQRRAVRVLNGTETFPEFDAWLRADGHKRNPGSTADLVAASLFVALRQGMIAFPLRFS